MIFVVKHARRHEWANNVTQYNRCKTYLCANLTRTGSLNTGLTPEDEKRLEELLHYPAGELSRGSKFWEHYSVLLTEKELVLNTEEPRDELAYLLLKAHQRVANGVDKVTPSHDFVMVNRENEAIAKNKVNRKKREAVAEFNKMTPDQMRRCLKVLGISASNASIEVVEDTLYTFIENDPAQFFVKWVENSNRDIEYLINQAVTNNVLRKNKTTYLYGTDIIGGTLEDAIIYLKDKKNSDIRRAIMNAVEVSEDSISE